MSVDWFCERLDSEGSCLVTIATQLCLRWKQLCCESDSGCGPVKLYSQRDGWPLLYTAICEMEVFSFLSLKPPSDSRFHLEVVFLFSAPRSDTKAVRLVFVVVS